VLIGRAEKGPGMIPTRVNSFSEFVETFGEPISGRSSVADTWRDGNYSSPTYAAYAAQAYLRANVGPITYVRLMGTQHPSADDGAPGTHGHGGWTTTNLPNASIGSTGGAYGLFVFASASTTTTTTTNAGTLAAVWYMDHGTPVLSGSTVEHATDTDQEVQGTAVIVKSDSQGQFKAKIIDSSSATIENVTFSLNETSPNFIRKVFNTNPQLVNTNIELSIGQKNYWLGETFERYLMEQSLDTAAVRYGVILALVSGSNHYGNHERDMAYRDAHSGWFFAQNFSSDVSTYEYKNMQKLFKFVGINGHGQWLQNNIKISIDNIRAPANTNIAYGSFDVIVRKAYDSDLKQIVLERYSNCNLNPGSPDYIGAKIGDTKRYYDETEKRYREVGTYPNQSRYVRVVMNDVIDAGGGSSSPYLPFGVYGPPRFPAWSTSLSASTVDTGHASTTAYVLGSSSIAFGLGDLRGTAPYSRIDLADCLMWAGPQTPDAPVAYGTASFTYPAVGIRVSASDDGANPVTNAYYGLHTGKATSATGKSTNFDPGYSDYLRPFGYNIIADSTWSDDFGTANTATGLPSATNLERQWIFSLDEVRLTKGTNWTSANPSNDITAGYWQSGSYKSGVSWNASASLTDGVVGQYENILDSRVNRFTSPLWGGFDGLDITERDPFRNSKLDDNSEAETSNYAFYTIKRAIELIADPEVLSFNLASIPGVTNESLTKLLIETVEARADALAIIDVKGGYTPRADDTSTNKRATDRKGSVSTVVSNMKTRSLNSSYGACYYPWVKIRDDLNGGVIVDVPPSIVALGVLANTERATDVWFAPAGFRRGGLSTGAGGLPVVGVEEKLTSRNRDDLYDVSINPIASFPSEGFVVFGQKTVQATQSALDRINVRRLMIYLKRGISRIASQTLFQPNVSSTWNSFKSKADNFLSDVKIRFGVDDFKVILDETTTTADLIDRNIMYAKIFVKPTRAIEFIVVDFIITRSGASFED